MVSRNTTPERAKHDAISTTTGLIASAFIIAFLISWGLPPLLSSIFISSSSDVTEIIVTTFAGLATSVFFMWFSSERIKNTVELAIDSAADQKYSYYKENNPDIEKQLRIQLAEYTCAIPITHRSKTSIQLSNPSTIICDERIGRDAIIRCLSYNDELLKGISLAAVDKALELTSQDKEKVTQNVRETFLTDIYAYLKGWLMISVAHSHPMPIEYIEQRYPDKNHPNQDAYIAALEVIRKKSIRSSRVTNAMQDILKDPKAVALATNLLDKYLRILVEKLQSAQS